MKSLLLALVSALLLAVASGSPIPASGVDQVAASRIEIDSEEWIKRASYVDQVAAPGGEEEWIKRASDVDQVAAPGGEEEWIKRASDLDQVAASRVEIDSEEWI